MNTNTTDNQQEVYDVVDKNDVVIGTAKRHEVHTNDNLIHRAVVAFIFNRKRELLLQKRSKTKDTFPGYWGLSVGGHVETGDTYDNAIQREMREELGVNIPLKPYKKELFYKEDGESEFWAAYIGFSDGPFPHFNTIEADEVRFFDVMHLIEDTRNGKIPLARSISKILPEIVELVNTGKIEEFVSKEEKYGTT